MSSDRVAHRLGQPLLTGTCLQANFSTLIALEDRWRDSHITGPPPSQLLRIIITYAGHANFSTNSQPLVIKAPSVTLLAPGWAYTAREHRGGWHMRALLCAGPWASAFQAVLSQHQGAWHLPTPPRALIQHLTQSIDLCTDAGTWWDWQVAEHLAASFRLLHQHAQMGNQPINPARHLRQVVSADPARNWSVEYLARELHVSSSTLAHQAQAWLGCSPARWVRDLRIELARRLLTTHDVSETAAALGFANPYHFSRVFSAVTGQPPSQWRRQLESEQL